jgi:hypothetical protein
MGPKSAEIHAPCSQARPQVPYPLWPQRILTQQVVSCNLRSRFPFLVPCPKGPTFAKNRVETTHYASQARGGATYRRPAAYTRGNPRAGALGESAIPIRRELDSAVSLCGSARRFGGRPPLGGRVRVRLWRWRSSRGSTHRAAGRFLVAVAISFGIGLVCHARQYNPTRINPQRERWRSRRDLHDRPAWHGGSVRQLPLPD